MYDMGIKNPVYAYIFRFTCTHQQFWSFSFFTKVFTGKKNKVPVTLAHPIPSGEFT